MQDPTTIESPRSAVLECAEAIGELQAEVADLRGRLEAVEAGEGVEAYA